MQHIGKALRGFIKNSGLEKVLDQQSLIDSWEDVVGEKISKNAIEKIVEEHFDLRPKSLINMLDLKRPIYLPTAAYGHFGRTDIDLTWERTDKASEISQ